MKQPTEHQEQKAVVQWFDLQYPEFSGRLFAVPNAGAGAQKGQSGKMKAEGTRSGVPDLFLPVARHGFIGLFIEMKRRTGGSLSAEQSGWLEFLGKQGYMAVVCKGADAAIETIRNYLSDSNG